MAGLIPRRFIDDLLARTDIIDVIDPRVKLKKQGKNYTACCPFHNEKSPSFNVSQDKQFYHCFGCGASGNAIGFLMEYERLDFVEAIEELAAKLSLEVPREASTPGMKPQGPKISHEKKRDIYD
ncbi:MAG: CHC2 zinc finger domain-containing protein, partial [Vibrio sp.]